MIARLMICLGLLGLAGCNTLQGAEQDAGIAGEAVVDGAQDVRTDLKY